MGDGFFQEDVFLCGRSEPDVFQVQVMRSADVDGIDTGIEDGFIIRPESACSVELFRVGLRTA